MTNATNEVLIATTCDGLVKKFEGLKNTFKKTGGKIKIKIAAPLNSDKAREVAKILSEYAQVKDIDLNSRFVVVDGKELVFMVNNDKDVVAAADSAIWVNTPFFAKTLKTLFDNTWK
jgi:imidazole glycerol phosphate synthase subunit HisF